MRFGTMARALALLVAMPGLVQAEQGITDNQVSFAQVAALEGPAAALGQGMRLGLMAAFAEVNAKGGVHGSQLVLDSLDDGYEPDRSVAHVKAVIAANGHIGLIGAVGTPTAAATQPVATERGFPLSSRLPGRVSCSIPN